MLVGAAKRGIEVSVSKEYVFNLLEGQGYKCALSGEDIALAHGRNAFMHGRKTASIDRIDSSKGYISENIQWVHKDINRMKGPMSQDDFLNWCRKVAGHRHKEFT
jgi:hypothetical protein